MVLLLQIVLSLITHTQTHTILFMFDFENLEVYSKSKMFNKSIFRLIQSHKYDRTTNDQLRRASFSIMLNIAEGSGRFSKKDKRNFYIIARGSIYECIAILDYLKDTDQLDKESFNKYYQSLEELSKMLYAMIQGLS